MDIGSFGRRKRKRGSEEKSEQLFFGNRIRARNLHLGGSRERDITE